MQKMSIIRAPEKIGRGVSVFAVKTKRKKSNLEEKSEVIVKQLKLLVPEKKGDFLVPMVAFDSSIDAQFFNRLVFEVPNSTIGENKHVLEKMDSLEIPQDFFDEIANYFLENLSPYLETIKFPNMMRIFLKSRPKFQKKEGAS